MIFYDPCEINQAMIQWYYIQSMKEDQRQEHRLQEFERKEDFVVTVLQRTGERFFDRANIQNLKAKQREIFKGIPSTSHAALDKMLDGVMKKLREKHEEQIRLMIRQNKPAPREHAEAISQSKPQQDNKQSIIVSGNSSNAQDRYKLMKARQKGLRNCYFKIEYIYNNMGQAFKQKYKHHIVEVINHIHSNISRTNFLSDYKVLKKPKPPAFELKVKVEMGDSDFVYKSKDNNTFLKELSAQQVMFWMWSFAHMIDQMERIGVYHQDLKPSNTIKLGRIFRCIDFQYSILIDDLKTKQSIKEMLKSFKDPSAMIFGNMAVQSRSFACKKQSENGKNLDWEDYKRKDEEILKIHKQLLKSFDGIYKQIQQNIPDDLDKAYEYFKDYLKVFHKISFLRCLLDVSQITSNMGTLLIKDQDNKEIDKEQEILQIIKKKLDFNGQTNVYHQFIKAIEERNPYLIQQQPIPLRYIKQLNEKQEVPNNIKQIAIMKQKSFIASLKEDCQFIAPIIQDSMTEEGTSCLVRNSCRFFESPLDFWNLKKPRYLHYLFISAKSALDILECANIYLTHLSIKDFAKEGQFFLIRTLENALILTTSQEKHDVQKLSREFIEELVKGDSQKTSEVISLNAIYRTKWFTDIKQAKKPSLDESDYIKLITFLKENKQNLLHGLLKQLFDQIEDPSIQIEQEYKKQLYKIRAMIDKANKTDDIQNIFDQFKKIQQAYPGQSFAGTVDQCSESQSSSNIKP